MNIIIILVIVLGLILISGGIKLLKSLVNITTRSESFTTSLNEDNIRESHKKGSSLLNNVLGRKPNNGGRKRKKK